MFKMFQRLVSKKIPLRRRQGLLARPRHSRRSQLIKFHFPPGKPAFGTRLIAKPAGNCPCFSSATRLRRGQFHRGRRRHEIRIHPVENHHSDVLVLENIKEPVRNPRLSGVRRLRLFDGEGEGGYFRGSFILDSGWGGGGIDVS